ncbi:hypothetical protein [Glaciecola sp. SC05]|uniref:hypothetical protein n=1 Tax=Glaciecola sp. SC05 TaxID=1987355 RepID=UPI003529A7FE
MKNSIHTIYKYCLLLFLANFIHPAYAQENKQIEQVFAKLIQILPEGSQIIARPYAESLTSYGDKLQAKLVDMPSMIGGKAFNVKTKKSKNVYDAGVNTPVIADLKKGDVVYITFFAQATKLPKNADRITIHGVGVQQNAPPYGSLFSKTISVDEKMQSYSFSGVADRDYKAGELQVAFQVASASQEIAFGPVFLFNVGQGIDPSSLPYVTN